MSREYLSAGKILDSVEKGGNFKAVCNKNSARIGKKDYLLASETLKYKQVLESILRDAGVSSKRLDIGSHGTLLVLVYEMLIGTGNIRGGGKVKRMVMNEMESIKDSLQTILKKNHVNSIKELLPSNVLLAGELPQFLRINTLKVTDLGKIFIYDEIKACCSGAAMDKQVDNLVVIPPRSPSFGQHEFVKSGQIIIQDKASCFPSQILSDAWKDGDVVDACAAPGNKTSHMAAILTSKMTSGCGGHANRIFAFDKSRTRTELLQSRMTNAGADMLVDVKNYDFLSIDTNEAKYARVSAVLLDPSCSGSGLTVKDLGRLGGAVMEKGRLEKLRAFQVQAVLKAMTFPAVHLISYSTCSLHEEENESVVAEVLDSKREAGWRLVAPPRLASWKRRGHDFEGLSEYEKECLIRCDPQDGANGFFVALFEKRNGIRFPDKGEENDEEEEKETSEENGEEKEKESSEENEIGGGEEEEEEKESSEENGEEEEEGYGVDLYRAKKRRRVWVPMHRQATNGW